MYQLHDPQLLTLPPLCLPFDVSPDLSHEMTWYFEFLTKHNLVFDVNVPCTGSDTAFAAVDTAISTWFERNDILFSPPPSYVKPQIFHDAHWMVVDTVLKTKYGKKTISLKPSATFITPASFCYSDLARSFNKFKHPTIRDRTVLWLGESFALFHFVQNETFRTASFFCHIFIL